MKKQGKKTIKVARADLKLPVHPPPVNFFIKKNKTNSENTLNHHPDLQDHPRLCSVRMDSVV